MESSAQPKATQQQQIKDLEGAQNLLAATLDSSLDMIQVFEAARDPQSEIVDFTCILSNHASKNLYGDVNGKSLLRLQPGVLNEGAFESFKQVVQTSVPQQYNKRYTNGNLTGWFRQSVVKLNDGVAITTTAITDLTEHKRQEQRFESIANLVPDLLGIASLMVSPTGIINDGRHIQARVLTKLSDGAGRMPYIQMIAKSRPSVIRKQSMPVKRYNRNTGLGATTVNIDGL